MFDRHDAFGGLVSAAEPGSFFGVGWVLND